MTIKDTILIQTEIAYIYNATQYKQTYILDASPKGKGGDDDDDDDNKKSDHNAFSAYSLFYYSERHSELDIIPKNPLTREVRMADAQSQSN